MIKVISTGRWLPDQFKDSESRQGICDLQITKINITGSYPIDTFGSSAGRPYSVVCYVRENVKLAAGGFTTNSAQRWGMKSKGHIPSTASQVLEIAMGAPLLKDEVLMQEISQQIEEADPLKRKAITNKQFTVGWAELQLKNTAI